MDIRDGRIYIKITNLRGETMDRRDGRIYTPEEIEAMGKALRENDYTILLKCIKPMFIPPTKKQMNRKPPMVRRNDTCPCGSGKKFKECCLLHPTRDKEV